MRSFWGKFWKLVSIKHLIFGSVIMAVVIMLSFYESANRVKVSFHEAAVDIHSSKYSMNIPYEMVDSIELVDLPDRGEPVKGTDDMAIRVGSWINNVWGNYYICADLNATNCIVTKLNDGRIFVFSRLNNEETADIYKTLQSYLTAR